MKKIEFLQELKNRGSITNAEEAQKAIDTWRNAGRGFDDDPVETSAQETPQPEQPKKESFISKYEGGATKAFTEGAKRIAEREQRWESPSTALGNAVYGKTGNATLATLAAVPERTVRLAGGAIANVADLLGYTPADVLSGGTLGKLMGQAAKIPGVATVAQKASQFAEAHPEAAKDLASLVDVAALAPAGAVAKGARSEIKTIAQELTKEDVKLSGKLESAANRIQGTKVKINAPEQKSGAKNEYYSKYKVFGNAKQVNEQWNNKITAAVDELKIKLQQSADNPENYADINTIFNDAQEVLLKGKSKTAQAELSKSLNRLRATFDSAYPDGKINILDAQVEKQYVGKKGDWLSKNGSMTGNPKASLDSQTHNALYDALKRNIENKGVPGIKEVNKQISEMIPMERASAKQVLVQNRKNPISLDDYIGALTVATSAAHGHILPAAIVLGNVATKSPSVAKMLYKKSQSLKYGKQNNGVK